MGSPLYTLYVFPTRRNLNPLLTRLKSKGLEFSTYPDDVSKGWVKRRWRNRNHMKNVYAVIIYNADYSLLYELRQFGRVRYEAHAPTPSGGYA